MSSNTNTNIINPKPCNYNCGTRIYWNNQENAYWEVFSKKKHVCPNRSTTGNNNNVSYSKTQVPKPSYYNKFTNKQPKPKMSNSLELLSGPIAYIQQKYELLSDIVTEYSGKVHGSQSHIITSNLISLIVYFEVPEGKREEVKQKFKNSIRNQIVLQR
jgi:hypothetical protein